MTHSGGHAGILMGKLGAEVVATDLEPNLPLLKDNFTSNGEEIWAIACCETVALAHGTSSQHRAH